MIIRRGKYDDDDERGSSVMKMFECGRTTLVMLRTLPNDFPDQTSTAFAFITAAAFQFGKSVLFDGGDHHFAYIDRNRVWQSRAVDGEDGGLATGNRLPP